MLGLYKFAGSYMSNSLLFIIEGNLNKAFKINVRYFEKNVGLFFHTLQAKFLSGYNFLFT